MSKRKRRHLSAEFKARIAREAMENQRTIQQIAKEKEFLEGKCNELGIDTSEKL